MDSDSLTSSRVGLGALFLAAGGVLFALYQAVRPFVDTAETMASTAWTVSHMSAMGGFILITLGLLGLHIAVQRTPAEPLALRALVVSWLGAGLTLPYYGAETFSLQLIAQRSLDSGDGSLLELVEDFHGAAVPNSLFAAGLLLLGLGAILAAVAIWRSGTLQRWSGAPLALGFALLIPQFFTPQPVRIVHGVLVAAGCIWIAVAMRRAGKLRTEPLLSNSLS